MLYNLDCAIYFFPLPNFESTVKSGTKTKQTSHMKINWYLYPAEVNLV